MDLARALAPLAEGLPRPRVHLDLPKNLELTDPEQAQALVRCVQEIVTNTGKHADAENLWIEFRTTAGGLEVRARDDGRGARDVQPGHGLSGMRQRLEGLGGRLQVVTEPDRGFQVEAWIPLRGSTS